MEDKIAGIRARFEIELKKNSILYHPIDVVRVRKEEWQVKRYLIESNENVDTAFEALIRTLAWKKSFGVHKLKPSDFPVEIYSLFCTEIYGKDKEGRLILSESYKRQKPFSELDQVTRKILAYQAELADRLTFQNDASKGAIYLGDFTDTPVLYLDVSLAKFRVDLLNQHYPLLCKKIVLLNVPFLLKPVIKLIVSFMKASIREAVVNMNYDQLKELIDEEVLHEDMKGKRKERPLPEGTKKLNELAGSLGISDDFVKQFYKFHQLN